MASKSTTNRRLSDSENLNVSMTDSTPPTTEYIGIVIGNDAETSTTAILFWVVVKSSFANIRIPGPGSPLFAAACVV